MASRVRACGHRVPHLGLWAEHQSLSAQVIIKCLGLSISNQKVHKKGVSDSRYETLDRASDFIDLSRPHLEHHSTGIWH